VLRLVLFPAFKRAKLIDRRASGDAPPKRARKHTWLTVAAGRICQGCGEVQANGEFDDTTPCSRR
jgi:hypothetical protein